MLSVARCLLLNRLLLRRQLDRTRPLSLGVGHLQQLVLCAIEAKLVVQDNAEALTYKGVIAIEKKDYSEAIAPLNRVLEARPNDWNALRNRAIAYLQMGKLDKARRDYQQLMRIIPHYYVAYYGLGEIAYREKENAAAIKQYENYLKHFPTDSTPDLDEEKKQVANRLKDLKMAKRW